KKLFSKKVPQSKKENWGIYEKSVSGNQWFLGRRENWHVPCEAHPDSRSILEKLGFKILGIADEMRYCVEPPEGFTMNFLSDVWVEIFNAEGEKILQVFEKQELWELRCFVREIK
ncbi:MAG: hypothetical protein OEX08_02670, partial [Candidatus Nomurabacteria bacterium]|nr:hypothetical protein [Candidatus Nomurabacteria bacterium]